MSDLVILGSGIAGLSAAIEAKALGLEPLVISKTYPTKSQSCMAQGGINCADESEVDFHIEDTIKASCGKGDTAEIKFMCENAPRIIKKLESFGVPFSRDEDNSLSKRKLGGTKGKYARFAQDYSGLKILHTLFDKCLKEDVKFLNEHFVKSISKNENSYKIYTIDLKSGKVKIVTTQAIIFATGGYSKLYGEHSTNSSAAKGEGLVLAKKLGCELTGLEYVQFHPTALLKNSILISESARGAGGKLIDENGERFIDELLPRDVVARAINEKRKSGKVFLDVSHLGSDFIKSTIPQEAKLAQTFQHTDLSREPVEIKPAAHYTIGGIKADIECKTGVDGVFACGECANIGVHGANRLGGNSLLEATLFGEVAARSAKAYLEELGNVAIEEEPLTLEDLLGKNSKFYPLQKKIEDLLHEKVGLERSQDGLLQALEIIEELERDRDTFGIDDESLVFNTNLQDLLEFQFSIELTKELILAALNNKNSSGVHFRSDDEN